MTRSLDPFEPAYVRDPYDVYAQLRTEGAACYVSDLRVWVISRYAEIRAVLGDAETFTNAATLVPVTPVCPRAQQVLKALTNDRVTAAGDGASHARTRRALMAVFPSTPSKAEVWEPVIRRLAEELVDDMTAHGAGDIVRDVSLTLPLRMISAVFGGLDDDYERLRYWSAGGATLMGGPASDAEQVIEAAKLVLFWEYSQELVSKRRSIPCEDVVSGLLAYRASDDAILTEREIASIAFDLLGAVYETTSGLLSNSVHQLLSTGAWKELAVDPARIGAAVEEVLRYDPPIVGWSRWTARPVRIGDVDIPASSRLLLLLGSGNRDECRFENGESFDIARASDHTHLSFGAGRHYCPGAALARLAARVTLETLVKHLPGLRLREDFEPRYVPNVTFRMLGELEVEWDPV